MVSASSQAFDEATQEGEPDLSAESPDSATINGRLLLSANDVQLWFVDAKLERPQIRALLPIAQAINHLDLFRAFWSDDPVFRDRRNDNPSRLAQKRITSAIETLCEELPRELEHSKLCNPGGYEEIDQLLDLARKWLPALKAINGKKQGRAPCKWHNVARSLKKLFERAMAEGDLERHGFASATSKGLLLLQAALSHLGVRKSNDQIVEALRSPRTRVRALGK